LGVAVAGGSGFGCRAISVARLAGGAKTRALWQSVDRQLTNQAVWVPIVTPREVDLTSNRLHNYEYNPVWGFLADQSWLQ
jgi:ABC-type transport system substrate-binding protein